MVFSVRTEQIAADLLFAAFVFAFGSCDMNMGRNLWCFSR